MVPVLRSRSARTMQGTQFKKFKRKIGRDDAFGLLFKMWGFYESGKAVPIQLDEEEEVALLLDASDGLSGEALYEAFVSTRLMEEDSAGPILLTSSTWRQYNAQLVASWENGRQHKGKKTKKTDSRNTELKTSEPEMRQVEGTGQNQIEHKQTEGNQIEDNEDNLTRHKDWVNPGRTQQEPSEEENHF